MDIDDAKARIRYDQLDANIVNLLKPLNSIPWLVTLESCGGHPDPKPGQAGEGEWMVVLQFELDAQGWRTLAFLTLAAETTPGVWLLPRFFKEGGRGLAFVLAGSRTDPDRFAQKLKEGIPGLKKTVSATNGSREGRRRGNQR